MQGLDEPKKPQASSDEPPEQEEANVVKRKKAKAKNNSRIKGLDSLPIEEQLRQQQAGPALRHAMRASQAKPILKRLENYLTHLKSRHFPQSGMGRAICYALGQWSGLDAYLLDGRIELNNNLIENAHCAK